VPARDGSDLGAIPSNPIWVAGTKNLAAKQKFFQPSNPIVQWEKGIKRMILSIVYEKGTNNFDCHLDNIDN